MKDMILFVNACVRKESRTRKLAEKLLIKLNGPYEEIRLEEISFPVVNGDFLNKRDPLIAEGDFKIPCSIWQGSFRKRKPS